MTRIESLLSDKTRLGFALLWVVLAIIGFKHYAQNFNDYLIYKSAGEKLLQGRSLELYDVARLEPGGFYYPYFWAFVFSIFLKVTFGFDKIIFLGIFLATYYYVLTFSLSYISEKVSLSKSQFYGIASAVLLLNLYSFNDALINSNIGVLLCFFTVLAWKYEKSHPLRAALFLALGAACKFYPLLFLGYFGWKQNYKAIFWTLIFFFFFYFGVPLIGEGWVNARTLMSNHSYVMSRYGDQVGWNYSVVVFQNISGTLFRYLSLVGISEKSSIPWVFGSILLSLILFYLPGYLKGAFKNYITSLKFAILTMALIALVAPISWYNMGVFYLPLIAFHCVNAWVLKDRVSQISLFVYLCLYCLTSSDLWGRPLNDLMEFWSLPFWGVVALLVGLFKESRFENYLHGKSKVS